jgi:hypothetical protein
MRDNSHYPVGHPMKKKTKKKNRWQYSEELYDVGLKRAIS